MAPLCCCVGAAEPVPSVAEGGTYADDSTEKKSRGINGQNNWCKKLPMLSILRRENVFEMTKNEKQVRREDRRIGMNGDENGWTKRNRRRFIGSFSLG